MLVKGYVMTGFRGLWWHISDELFEEFNVQPNDKISGTLLKVYAGKDGKMTHEPKEPFEWQLSKESGLAVLLPPKVIVKYELTEMHFLELEITHINGKPVCPGEERMSVKWWPEEMMKLHFVLDFIPPAT
jgi:hypothetical protein